MAELGTPGRTTRRVRPIPLVFGVAFAAIGVIRLSGSLVGDATWVWVIALTALGVAGMASAVRG